MIYRGKYELRSISFVANFDHRMKISYNWLKEYIKLDLTAERVGEILTDCGLEVEGIEEIQSIKGGLSGLIVGEVLTCERIPETDKLKVTTLDVGAEAPLNIVCGAPNVAVGQKVVVATVGTVLYTSEGDSFKIKKGKLKGHVSEGMICAEDEIGLGESHDGIMILDTEAKVGMHAAEYFDVQSDYVFEIGLTPNRADATSHIGTARDFVALSHTQEDVTVEKVNWPDVSGFRVDDNSLVIPIQIENPKACPRYAGVTISGVEVKPSPDWLQNRLKAIGLIPKNNVVDITNYVLHEMGQPLHAFDASKIEGNTVVVKHAEKGDKFTTLDEVERTLDSEDLMICNEKSPMCIAGVFGGMNSGVTEQTQYVFLESAYFNPVSVRKTAKRHGLNTDASFRFERGIDPNMTIIALKRAALLIQELAGGKISSDIQEFYPEKIADFEIEFSYKNCDRLIGKTIDRTLIKNILIGLEIVIKEESEHGLTLQIPAYKVDVQREVDIIEEVLRIYGYNKVEIPTKVQSSLAYAEKPNKEKLQNTVADWLSANGFNEMMHNSLTKSAYYEGSTIWNKEACVKMLNPLSSELDVMRQTLVFNLLEAIEYNQNRRSENLKVYEFGSVYQMHEGKSKEEKHLVVGMTGNNALESWNIDQKEVGFHDLKGIVDALLVRLGVNKFNVQLKEDESGLFTYGLQVSINKKPVAQFGLVGKEILSSFSLRKEVFIGVIFWEKLVELSANVKVKYKPLPKYPAMRRDLALILNKEVKFESVELVARKTDKKLLKEINLFDVYEGKNLESGKKSYGVSFTFRDDSKTLTDKQVDKIMQKLLNNLEKEVQATLR